MGRSYFLEVLLITAVLALGLSQGLGRKEITFGKAGAASASSSSKVDAVKSERARAMMEFAMDYQDPGANTNPGSGYTLPPPPPTGPSD